MARDFYINGETMVSVKSSTFSLTQLGLAEAPIQMTFDFRHKDILLDAWGSEIPADVQYKLAAVSINMTLIHFDATVLDNCMALSMASSMIGLTGRAGTRMGAGLGRFVSGNRYIGLNLASPVAGKPYRFYYAYLTQQPVVFPVGTEKTVATCNWRAIPYTTDPWGGGAGAGADPSVGGGIIWDNTLDT